MRKTVNGMKAWKVEDKASYEGGCTVVFAETLGKAHALALSTDCCEDAEWNDVRVTRIPVMDKHYRGKWEMNWYNSEDRIALVKECGWFCSETNGREACLTCPAAEWCGDYQDWKYDEEGGKK